jgi:hypothetical protein
MTWFEKIRLGFLTRSRREKLLATLFVVVLAVLWAVLLVGRVRAFGPKLAQAKEEAMFQDGVLDARERIEIDYETAFSRLSDNPDRPSGKIAYETVDQIVRSSGFTNFRLDPPQPERRDQLTFHPINLNVFKADFAKLAELFNAITTRLPTVNLAEVVISAPDRTNPQAPLDARFKFVAIEINR